MGNCVSSASTSVPNLAANPCSPNPCQNSGVCIQLNRFYYCTCTTGFTGLIEKFKLLFRFSNKR